MSIHFVHMLYSGIKEENVKVFLSCTSQAKRQKSCIHPHFRSPFFFAKSESTHHNHHLFLSFNLLSSFYWKGTGNKQGKCWAMYNVYGALFLCSNERGMSQSDRYLQITHFDWWLFSYRHHQIHLPPLLNEFFCTNILNNCLYPTHSKWSLYKKLILVLVKRENCLYLVIC